MPGRSGQIDSVFAVENRDGQSEFLLVCEHASNHFPARFGTLGLSEAERQAQHAAKVEALQAVPAGGADDGIAVLLAVATEGHGKVNQHFGHATEFQIYEVAQGSAVFVGHRRVDLYCQGGWGEDEQLPSIVNAINDCHAVLVSKIGACPRDELTAAGIEPVDAYAHEFIEKAALSWFAAYRERIARGELVHQPRGDARICQGTFTAAA